MNLSSDLLSQLVRPADKNEKKSTESVVYGTAKVEHEGKIYVQIDGSDQMTPVSTTADVSDGERVTVLIKDHSATITGNISSPSAKNETVKEQGAKLAEFDIVIADKVSTEELIATNARIETLETDNVKINGSLEAQSAEIEDLKAQTAEIENLKAKDVEIEGNLKAANGEIENLKTTTITAEVADLKYATIDSLKAVDGKFLTLDTTYADIELANIGDAAITNLFAKQATIDNLNAKYANVDFANISDAAIEALFSKSGMIENLVISDGHVTGNLVGVTIKGDIIEGGTIIADKLVIQGENGLYYQLNTNGETTSLEQTEYNSLNGSVITAKSLTAEQIFVDDFYAFGATIGGFHITTESLYSGVKESVDNTTRGTYLDSEGQMAIGDSDSYIKYYRDENDEYNLDIKAKRITIGGSTKTVTNEDGTEETVVEEGVDVDSSLSNLDTKIDDGLKTNADDLANFKNVTTESLEAIDGRFTSFYDRVYIYDGGIFINDGGENVMGIRLGNGAVSFEQGGRTFGQWDGENFYTGNIKIELNERAQFGNFAFVPRTDGSLSFLKVDDTAHFYARVIGRTMVLYGSYPIVDDESLVLDHELIPASVEGETLNLKEGGN